MIRKTAVAMTSFLALSVILLLNSCGGKEEIVIEDGAKQDAQFEGINEIAYGEYEIGKAGGQLVMSIMGDPKTFFDGVASETSSTDITYRLYTPLVNRSQQDLEWQPMASESWEYSEDQKTITHHIRKDMKWSDGTPLTAQDFVFAYNHVMLREDVGSNSRDGMYVNDLPVIVKLIDDYTLSITTDTVYAGMLSISNSNPYPRHILGPVIGWSEEDGYDYEYDLVDGEIVEKKSDHIDYTLLASFWGVDTDVTSIVCSGPFTVSDYIPGQKVVLKKNPYYYEKDAKGNQLPYLDEVIMLIVGDQDTQLAKFQSGETDFYGLRGEDYALLVGKKEEIGFDLYNVGPTSSTQFITMNQNPEATDVSAEVLSWTSNKKFRMAMAYVVDRDTMINNIAYGFGYPQYSFVPRVSPYYWDDADNKAYKYDPETAKGLLDELGWIDSDGDGIREDDKGNKLSLRMTTNSGNREREAIGELFAQEARKVGVEVNFQPEDFNTMVTKLLSGNDWDIILIGLTGSVDPINGSNVYRSQGNLHMIEPNQTEPRRDWEKVVDEAWKIANNTTDELQRKEGWQTIQEIWVDEIPWIYTYNSASMQAYDTKLGNIQPRPVDNMGWGGIVQYLYWK
jgi:peptide/nickel transport system substrate-binding protein